MAEVRTQSGLVVDVSRVAHPSSPSGPPGSVTLRLAGEDVTLLPQRGAYWHSARTLLVCDLHLGKVEAFASGGVALPEMMGVQLSALDATIAAVNPQRVLILGDLLHAPAGLTEPMLEAVRVWRGTHACEFAVVPGNHDRHLEKVAQWWGMILLQERHNEGPFTFVHVPPPSAIPGRFVFAGHLHPVVKLRSSADTLKLWCFVIDEGGGGDSPQRRRGRREEGNEGVGAGAIPSPRPPVSLRALCVSAVNASGLCILPAFCDFTSGGVVEQRVDGRRVYAIADGRVVKVTRMA